MASERSPIIFADAGQPTEDLESVLDREREKHKKRAARFKTDYKKPEKRQDLRQDVRDERVAGRGFATGIDVFSEEEAERREKRAGRFNIQAAEQSYAPAPGCEPYLEDAGKMQARAARFGVEWKPAEPGSIVDAVAGQDKRDLLEARQDRDAAVQRRPEAVHLYGVDIMSTKECLQYFGEYGPKNVEWIDDSSCNVVFRDDTSAKRAIFGMGKPIPTGSAPEQQGLDPSDVANLSFLWHKGPDFDKGGVKVPLVFRTATVEDVKPKNGQGGAKHSSRFLWTMSVREARQIQQQGKASSGDGDGKKVGNNKKRRRDNDVEMAEAEEGAVNGAGDGPAAKAARPEVADLRELLPKAKKEEAPERLFSASRAGLIPAFLLDNEEPSVSNGAANGAVDPAIAGITEPAETLERADVDAA